MLNSRFSRSKLYLTIHYNLTNFKSVEGFIKQQRRAGLMTINKGLSV